MPSDDELVAVPRTLTVTDPSPDPDADELLRYAARVCNAQHGVLALIGRTRFWFKSRLGVAASGAPNFAVPADVEVAEEAARDGSRHPLLAVVPGARGVAIAPLRDGTAELGVLALFHRTPRSFSEPQIDALRFAAGVAVALLKLRRRVRLFETLVDSTPDRFYAFDTTGRCLYASEPGARALGLDSARMLGRTLQELGVDPGYAATFADMLRLAVASGRLVEDAREVRKPTGVEHEEYAVAPLRGARGEIEGVAVAARDVTARVAADADRRAALEKAQRAVRQRDDVLAVVSHDLRNTLSVFRLTAAALGDELPADSKTALEHVAILQQTADSMRRLVDDLVDVGRIDAGSLRTVRASCEARALVESALAAVRPLANQKGIALEAHVPEPDVVVRCDRRRVLQVFANLLGNAIKFTDKGAIRVEVTNGEREVRFSVSDTGSGISPEHLPHLFERYWQARAGERTGAGLGLYIARGIVEAHGGRIWAESAQGKGTTVAFTLAR